MARGLLTPGIDLLNGGMMTLGKLLVGIGLMILTSTSVVNAQDRRFEPPRRTVISCESVGNRYADCFAGTEIAFARLISQDSRASCIEGRTWGFTYDSIWVDQGCRGTFEVMAPRRGGGGGHRPPPRVEFVSCSSTDHRFNSCFPDSGERILHAQLHRQESRTRCVEGTNWGYDYSRVWVDQGCRGTFRLETR